MIMPSISLALTPYQSGYKRGVSDGKKIYGLSDFMSKGGFGNHTQMFSQGYIDGWCSLPINKHAGSDPDQGTFSCDVDSTAAYVPSPPGKHSKEYLEGW